MAEINWNALRTPDFAGDAIAASQQGRQDGLNLAKQNALRTYATNPDAGITQLMSVDPATAMTLQKARDEQRSQDTAVQAGQLAATGDLEGAGRVAAGAGNFDLLSKIQGMTQTQREQASQAYGELASTALSIKSQPYEQRKAALQAQAPRLQALGLKPEQIANFDPTDQNIEGFAQTQLGVKGQLDQFDKDRTFGLQRDQFGETQRHNQVDEAHSTAQLGETTRHDKADEGMSGARLGMERERLRFDQSQKADAVFDPQTITAMAQQAWAGDKSVFSNLGRGVQGAQNIAALRKEIYAMGAINGKTPAQLAQMNAQFIGDTAAARTAGTRVGAATVSTEELPGLVQQSAEAYSKLPRTQFKPFNQLQQAVMNQRASPEQAAAYAADFAVVNAYARAVSPSGQPHVADQKRGAELLSNVSGPAEHDAVLRQIIKETATIKAGAQRALHPGSDQPAMRKYNPATGRIE